MATTAIKGPRDLQKNVLTKGLCLMCGACTKLCPYIDMVYGKGAVIIEDCGLSEGKCYNFCPRTHIDVPSLDTHVFGHPRKDPTLGVYTSIMKARAKNSAIRSNCQYGGVVSTLVAFALENGVIDAAVLASSRDRLSAEPKVVRSKAEVLECAGSKYVVCPTVEGVVEAISQENTRLGVVGTPCQITAIRKMQTSKFENNADRVELLIGLFCTWALTPKAKNYILEKIGSPRILKVDVPPPPANIFVVQTEKGKCEISLDEIRRFIMPSCNVCFDMTNEFADISVGTVEGEEDWNTVIVRTTVGEKLFKKAVEAGEIEIGQLEKERLNHLYEASLNRKRRTLKEIESKGTPYLTISEEDKAAILSQ
ncbi:MAG: Coenzyme F420 hydrogenase/dehydrogenase, beta subunit C-terminal domain [Candidatus Bathyarchaeia archaeon]